MWGVEVDGYMGIKKVGERKGVGYMGGRNGGVGVDVGGGREDG